MKKFSEDRIKLFEEGRAWFNGYFSAQYRYEVIKEEDPPVTEKPWTFDYSEGIDKVVIVQIEGEIDDEPITKYYFPNRICALDYLEHFGHERVLKYIILEELELNKSEEVAISKE